MSARRPELENSCQNDVLRREIERAGAVVMNETTYDVVHAQLALHQIRTPIFVFGSHLRETSPEIEHDLSRSNFVTDGIETAVARARVAAGVKDVTVIGDEPIERQLIRAGLVDDLHAGAVPHLLGNGFRFVQLAETTESPIKSLDVMAPIERSHSHFRVVRPVLKLQRH